MQLEHLLVHLTYRVMQGDTKVEIRGITNCTEELESGYAYVCMEGVHLDGHLLMEEAVKKGAVVLVVEKDVRSPEGVTVVRVTDSRYAMASMSAEFYENPSRRLFTIGVTGTKGKTTTTWMLREILNRTGHRAGLIGTIETDTGSRRFPSSHTTPESCHIQKYLKEMADAGCDTAVMEVSSQGLKLQRTAGIFFDVGVFTNLGEDHVGVGEHASLEEYRQCKHLLFLQCRVGIGNVDDPWYPEIFDRTGCRKVTFGRNRKADYRARDFFPKEKGGRFGVQYTLQTLQEEQEVFLSLPGTFNVYNSLAAVAALRERGVALAEMLPELERIQVPGRMELVSRAGDAKVYLDYAHNAMSLGEALKELRKETGGRLTVVFGCGGNRSRLRRYEMGRTAGELADHTIITSDNPREEPPETIMADIVEGMQRTNGKYQTITDRREAICYALERRQPGDVILIAGKGHETYQEIQGIRHPMDDRKIIETYERKSCTQTLL